MSWFTENEKTGTVAANTILAQSTTSPGDADFDVNVVLHASVLARIEFIRYAANGTTELFNQLVGCDAGDTKQIEFKGQHLAQDEKFVIRLHTMVIGSVQASMFVSGL
jgi:hypothetical protein